MGDEPFRLVLDTNILVRGLINLHSDSGRILRACEERKAIPLLSKQVLSEYRVVLHDPAITSRYKELGAQKVRTAIERLTYLGDVVRTDRVRFEFPRDPKDEPLIRLAIAGQATHLISVDRDLLDLPQGKDRTPKRFRQRLPNLVVVRPDDFVRLYGSRFGIERK